MSTILYCPECQAENSLTSKFCNECGHPFKGEPTALLGPNATAPAHASAAAVVAPAETTVASGLLPPDSVLQGRYRITQLLGQGGMGAVYLASDARFASRTCVIKEMLDHFNDPEQRAQATESFHREADLLSTFKHPGIPEVYDRFTEANRHYLVMEYINGVDLEQRLIDNGIPFSEKEVIAWSIQCCDVLSYLHHQKPAIIYRDMKPANIITTAWGKAYLVDFGIARFFNPVTRGTMIGTQGYAPPEQYRGQVEPRSDLYALGATMHYLLTGRDPQNEPPFSFPPVSTLNPEISPEMEMLILKALDPDAENRFASADEMLGVLMDIGGNDTDVIRDCPHCGHKSSVTRQFCPNCKQYISKKAHALKGNGSGAIVTDAAGMHQNKASGPTARLEPGNKAATATNLALPTGKTEFDLVSIKPYVIAGGTALAVALAGIAAWKIYHHAPQALVSQGEAAFLAGNEAKEDGARAYAAGDYTRAASAYQKASEDDPTDGEARIYWQNSVLMLGKADLVTVAVAGPYTGKFEAKGRAELQGAAHAQQELNARGKAPRVLLQLADDGSSHERALEASKRIVELKGVIGVIGHLDSRSTRAALPIYGLAGLPVISPTSTSIELADSSPNFFRLSPDDALQGGVLARYAADDLHARRVSVVLPEDNPYIQGLATSFAKEAEDRGVRTEQAIFGDNPDWNELVKGIKVQRPDAVFLAGSHLDAIALAKAARQAGVNAPIIGGDSLYLPELAREGGQAVDGMVCATYYHGALTSPAARDFELEFRSKFQSEANSRAALTYEALNLMVQAIDVVGPQREAVASYIKKLGEQGYATLSGKAKIDAKGNVRRPIFLMKVKDGRFVPVRQVSL